MSSEFTKTEQAHICTAINTAIANGHKVTAGLRNIAGAFPRGIHVVLILENNWVLLTEEPLKHTWLERHHVIKAYAQIEGDAGVLYEPPPPDNKRSASASVSPS